MKTEKAIEFGNFLKHTRKNLGFTLTQIHARTNINTASLSHWENGKVKPHPRLLSILSDLYQVDLIAKQNELIANSGSLGKSPKTSLNNSNLPQVNLENLSRNDLLFKFGTMELSPKDRKAIIAFISGMLIKQ